METLISRFSQDKCHALANASVVCILSHGREDGEIAGIDGSHVTDVQVEEMFTASNCPDLANKPKIFFFVACRGRT